SMVFGHAPVILPAVLRVRLPYHPVLYAPLALLHVSLLVRVAGDLAGSAAARTIGGVLGEASLLLFGACAVAASRLLRRESSCPPSGSGRRPRAPGRPRRAGPAPPGTRSPTGSCSGGWR